MYLVSALLGKAESGKAEREKGQGQASSGIQNASVTAFSAPKESNVVQEKFLKFLKDAPSLSNDLINRSKIKDSLSCLNEKHTAWKGLFMDFIDSLCEGNSEDFKRTAGFLYLANVEDRWPRFSESFFDKALESILDLLNGEKDGFIMLSSAEYRPERKGNDF